MAIILALCSSVIVSGSTVLYETGFEASEGYDLQFTLAGQGGWMGEGTGGNGLLEETIPGLGQQAYVGFHPPLDEGLTTTLWRPVNYAPAAPASDILKFSVTLQFTKSTTGGNDDFRWSVFNTNGVRLFSVDFETSTSVISYILQDEEFVATPYDFVFDGEYDLEIWMDFGRNQWTALLNDFVLVSGQPMTQMNSGLHFGDADAVWSIREEANPGNNFMAFDNYRVTAETVEIIPPIVENIGINDQGFYELQVYGQPGLTYSVDVTSDLEEWFSIGEYVMPEEGTFLLEDTDTPEFPIGFYRLRYVE